MKAYQKYFLALLAGAVSSNLVWLTGNEFPIGIIGVCLIAFLLENEDNKLLNQLKILLFYNLSFGMFIDYQVFFAIKEYFKLDNIILPILMQLLFSLGRFYFLYIAYILRHLFVKIFKIEGRLNKSLAILFIVTFCDHLLPMGFPHNAGLILTSLIEEMDLLPYFGLGVYSSMLYALGLLIFNLFKKEKSSSLALFSYVILIILSSYIVEPYNPYKKSGKFLNANIVQVGKQINEDYVDINSFFELGQKAVRTRNVDLTIFPENASPFLYLSQEHMEKSPLYSDILNISLSPVIIGSSYQTDVDKRVANSILFFKDKKYPEKYFKNKLFILGESNIWFVNKMFNKTSNMLAGNELKVFEQKEFEFSPLICYEYFNDLFFRRVVDNHYLDFLIMFSNEVWIPNNNMALLSTGAMRIKSKEYGINIVRADLARYSMLSDYNGKIVKRLDIKKGILPVTLHEREDYKTLFHKYNYLILFVFMSLFIITVKILTRGKNNE